MEKNRSFGRMTLQKLEQIETMRTHGISAYKAAGILEISEKSVQDYYAALKIIEQGEPLKWFGKRLSTVALAEYCKKHGKTACIEKQVNQEDLLDLKDIEEGKEIDDEQAGIDSSMEELLTNMGYMIGGKLDEIKELLQKLLNEWKGGENG